MREIRLAAEQSPDCVRQTPHFGFGASALNADFSGLYRKLAREMHRKHQNRSLGIVFEDGAGGVQPVHLRHLKIHYSNVGEQVAVLGYGIFTVNRFTGNLPGILLLQQAQSLLAHQLIVIDHKDVCH